MSVSGRDERTRALADGPGPVDAGPRVTASDVRRMGVGPVLETSDPHAFGEDALSSLYLGFGDDASLLIEQPIVVVTPAPVAANPHASSADLVPPELPLAMPEQDFSRRIALPRLTHRAAYWVPRAALFAGATVLTAAFAKELFDVLSFARITPIQVVFLIFSTMAFSWIALGSMSAALGFLPLFAGEKADTLELPPADTPLDRRTALLFPVYHESPARIAGVISAMAEELAAASRARNFEIFILSDTRGAEAGAREEAVYAELRRAHSGVIDIYYRRRRENIARKAGNIKDWVERWGGAYDYFVILDADSVMTGESLQRLAAAMQRDPKAGLIQTVPRLTGGTTLLQRLQQFACNVYGPAVAAGLAFWHRDQGNYWGHNAIIRTAAFAEAAGLPQLPGAAPFGGTILSHDFVEAVLLQRAGWGVHMVPAVEGSYEGLPPSLMDLVTRDRRWAQGNLQHLAIVAQRGLTPMGRLHLFMGACSYLVSAVWAASLVVGMVLALQGQQILPSYFEDAKTLFPIWPVIDPGAALRLFVATMAVVMLPKALGLALEMRRVAHAREVGGSIRAVAAVVIETVFSMLLAPILMCTQTTAVVQILAGRDSGWKAQRRDDGSIPFTAALRFHWQHSLVGLALLLVCWYASPGLIAWMAPIILGLILAAPLTWLTARPAGSVMSAILSTREDRFAPAILLRADARTVEWVHRAAAISAPAAALPRAA